MNTKQHATKKQWVNNEITEETKNALSQMTMKMQPYKNIWDSAKALLKGKFITITVILKKRREISNNLTYNLKELEK